MITATDGKALIGGAVMLKDGGVRVYLVKEYPGITALALWRIDLKASGREFPWVLVSMVADVQQAQRIAPAETNWLVPTQ